MAIVANIDAGAQVSIVPANEASWRDLQLVFGQRGEPVGWVAVEPRTEYLARLARSRIPWAGRDENKDDPEAWAVGCFVTRADAPTTCDAYQFLGD
jgi:hypothetical protein